MSPKSLETENEIFVLWTTGKLFSFLLWNGYQQLESQPTLFLENNPSEQGDV